jgi:hypothetical protein
MPKHYRALISMPIAAENDDDALEQGLVPIGVR